MFLAIFPHTNFNKLDPLCRHMDWSDAKSSCEYIRVNIEMWPSKCWHGNGLQAGGSCELRQPPHCHLMSCELADDLK